MSQKIDTSVPHSARIWNYWLGGKDNYEADRAAGDAYEDVVPTVRECARASRYFLVRGVRYLVREAGLRQFLDIGTGLPTVDNTHEVAQREAPESRVVYVDNDPLVLAHAHALLTSTPQGATEYIDADLREPEKILARAQAVLDFSRPVGLILSDVMGHIEDYRQARGIVGRLVAALPSGSYLLLSHGVDIDARLRQAQQKYNESGAVPYVLRSPEEVALFFEGLELIEPGVVAMPRWRPDVPALVEEPAGVGMGGLARLP